MPINYFEEVKDISKFDEKFIKIYNEESDEEYFLEIDIQYQKKLSNVYNDLAFLSEKIKIEKIEKPVANLHDKM